MTSREQWARLLGRPVEPAVRRGLMGERAWPARMSSGHAPKVTVRPLTYRDEEAWRDSRRRNASWLIRWDATVPPGGDNRPTTFRSLVRRLHAQARRGTAYPFAVDVDGQFAGQITVNNVVRGSAQFGSLGYWLDQEFAGQGVIPRAVAMVIDHCFGAVGLHRIEVCIRPENSNSLRVVEKLGIREIGFAPSFLHIDGAWRDHRIYAITADEAPYGLLRRYEERVRDG